MNKRQRKKNRTKIAERYEFIHEDKKLFFMSRQCGKTSMQRVIWNIITEKGYKNFKALKKSRRYK